MDIINDYLLFNFITLASLLFGQIWFLVTFRCMLYLCWDCFYYFNKDLWGSEHQGRCKQGIKPLLKPRPQAAEDLIKLSITGFRSQSDLF